MIAPPIEILTRQAGFPEGPLVMPDGSIAFCDIKAGMIRRLDGDRLAALADVGGGPNGLALGPDGWLYVANNGGAMRWEELDGRTISKGFKQSGFDARIEKINLANGSIERVLDSVDGRAFQAIDDLVFDPSGEGFWFTDLGRDAEHSRTYGGVYWSKIDGSAICECAYPLVNGANGIGLSPDGSTLYATEYGAGRLWSWRVEGPGALASAEGQAHGGTLVWQAPGAQLLDSLKVTPRGNVVIATQHKGVFSVVSPAGELLTEIEMPEDFLTNLCFDPEDSSIAYATLSTTGRLVKFHWDEAQLSGAIVPSKLSGDNE